MRWGFGYRICLLMWEDTNGGTQVQSGKAKNDHILCRGISPKFCIAPRINNIHTKRRTKQSMMLMMLNAEMPNAKWLKFEGKEWKQR